METEHKKYVQKNLVNVASAQVRVAARFELKTAAKRVLSTTAQCFITGMEKNENELHVRGKVVTRAIFIDEFDAFNSEEVTSEFAEKFTPKNLGRLFSVVPAAAIVQTNHGKPQKNEADMLIALQSEHVVNVGLNGLEHGEITYVSDLKGGVEVAHQDSHVNTWGTSFSDKFDIGETFTLDSSVEGILGVEMSAYLRDITVADGKFTIKGIVTVSASEVRNGDNGPVMHNNWYDFDFTKTFNKSDLTANDAIIGGVAVSNCSMKIENNTSAELAVEAEIMFTGHSIVRHDIRGITDAFSTTHALEFAHTQGINTVVTQQANTTADVEGNVTMPDNSPYIAKVIWTSPQTIGAINVKPTDDRVVVEGVMTATIVYQCEEQGIHSHNVQVPFSVNCKLDGVREGHNVAALVTPMACNVKARRGKELLVDARVGVNVSAHTGMGVRIISDVAMGAEKMRDDHAITIHVAATGETLWDIAKRTSIPTREIIRQNPSLERGISEGDRVIIYSKLA